MLLFLLQCLIAVVGSGLAKALLDSFADRLAEWIRWALSVGVLLVLIGLTQLYVNWLNGLRHLLAWQRQELKDRVQAEKDNRTAMLDVTSAPNDTEAFDYANEIVTALAATGLRAGHGAPIKSNEITVHGKVVVVPAPNEWWLEQKGLTLLVVDLDHKPAGAIQLMDSLNESGLRTEWKLDWQLTKTQYGSIDAPVVDECLLYVGPKPAPRIRDSITSGCHSVALFFESLWSALSV